MLSGSSRCFRMHPDSLGKFSERLEVERGCLNERADAAGLADAERRTDARVLDRGDIWLSNGVLVEHYHASVNAGGRRFGGAECDDCL